MRPVAATSHAGWMAVASGVLLAVVGSATVWAAAGSDPVDLVGEATRVAGYLLLLIALGALAVRFGRKYAPQMGGAGPIQIEDGRNFSPGVGVRLVRVGGRHWLLGVSKDRVTLLAEISSQELSGEGSVKKP
ncbi:MAG: flagellar biosynthetic protein FliO [Magnetococcales bacterium]|nr:flagellar biosynthetic protein FliO [Magnetococcales bacterium]